MESRSRLLGVRVFIISTLLVMPFGSHGDKVALIVFALLLTARGMVQALRDWLGRSHMLTCSLYSGFAIVAAWGNSRYRLGGGPFRLPIWGGWHGYPLPYQEMFPCQAVLCREFHLTGILVDTALIALGYFLLRYLAGRRAPAFWVLTLSLYSAVFVWLNIEWRFYNLPLLFGYWPHDTVEWVKQRHAFTTGFPFSFVLFAPSSKQILDANAAIGIAGWLLLYGVLRWARNYSAHSDI